MTEVGSDREIPKSLEDLGTDARARLVVSVARKARDLGLRMPPRTALAAVLLASQAEAEASPRRVERGLARLGAGDAERLEIGGVLEGEPGARRYAAAGRALVHAIVAERRRLDDFVASRLGAGLSSAPATSRAPSLPGSAARGR